MSNATELKTELRPVSLMLLMPALLLLSAYFWPLLSQGSTFPLHFMREVSNFPGTVFVVVASTIVVAIFVALPHWANLDRLSFICGFLLGLIFLLFSADLAPIAALYGGALGSLWQAKKGLQRQVPM